MGGHGLRTGEKREIGWRKDVRQNLLYKDHPHAVMLP